MNRMKKLHQVKGVQIFVENICLDVAPDATGWDNPKPFRAKLAPRSRK